MIKNDFKTKKSIVGEEPKMKKSFLVKSIMLIVLLVVVAAAIFCGYRLYNNYRAMQRQIEALSGQAANVQSVIDRVGKHIILPKDETPVFATITDIEALKKEQPFYEGCENGQQILIYKNAKIGIVYDPKRDIIVKIGPVYVDDGSTTGQSNTTGTNSPATTPPSSLPATTPKP